MPQHLRSEGTADPLEHARDASLFVTAEYSAVEPNAAFTLEQGRERLSDAKQVGAVEKGKEEIGHPERVYGLSTHRVEIAVGTSPHHHNAMEPGAIVAKWEEDGGLTVHMPSQFCYGDAVILGEAFGFNLKERLPRIVGQVLGGLEFDNKIRVITPLAGVAFGSKQANIHLLLAPMAAKVVGRAVKLVLSREQTFSLMPFRGQSHQRLRMSADVSGQLEAILQDVEIAQGAGGSFIEPAAENTTEVYACKNTWINNKSALLDTGAPGWMRGPGASLGQLAIEVAMDMLAEKAGLDPLEMRLWNHADVEPDTGKEWSSKSLKQCYQMAAEQIARFERDPRVRSMREGRSLLFAPCSQRDIPSVFARRQLQRSSVLST